MATVANAPNARMAMRYAYGHAPRVSAPGSGEHVTRGIGGGRQTGGGDTEGGFQFTGGSGLLGLAGAFGLLNRPGHLTPAAAQSQQEQQLISKFSQDYASGLEQGVPKRSCTSSRAS